MANGSKPESLTQLAERARRHIKLVPQAGSLAADIPTDFSRIAPEGEVLCRSTLLRSVRQFSAFAQAIIAIHQRIQRDRNSIKEKEDALERFPQKKIKLETHRKNLEAKFEQFTQQPDWQQVTKQLSDLPQLLQIAERLRDDLRTTLGQDIAAAETRIEIEMDVLRRLVIGLRDELNALITQHKLPPKEKPVRPKKEPIVKVKKSHNHVRHVSVAPKERSSVTFSLPAEDVPNDVDVLHWQQNYVQPFLLKKGARAALKISRQEYNLLNFIRKDLVKRSPLHVIHDLEHFLKTTKDALQKQNDDHNAVYMAIEGRQALRLRSAILQSQDLSRTIAPGLISNGEQYQRYLFLLGQLATREIFTAHNPPNSRMGGFQSIPAEMQAALTVAEANLAKFTEAMIELAGLSAQKHFGAFNEDEVIRAGSDDAIEVLQSYANGAQEIFEGWQKRPSYPFSFAALEAVQIALTKLNRATSIFETGAYSTIIKTFANIVKQQFCGKT